MNVNSVMSIYNMSSLWNNINPDNTSTATAPLIDNIDSSVKENYTAMNYSGQTTSTELQDIYQQVEPTYGISGTYNQNGTFSTPTPTTTTLPTDGMTSQESSTVSLLDSMNYSKGNSLSNIISEYDSIEDGTYQTSLSSILSSNLSGALGTNQTGTNVDATV